jgi:synaptobrevin family protein YKT6
MHIYAINVLRFRGDTPHPTLLATSYDLSPFNYFQKSSVREFITFFSRTLVERATRGQRMSVDHENYVVHIHLRTDGLAGVVVADAEYPARVAFTAINALLLEFHTLHGETWPTATADVSLPFPKLDQAIVEYQDPAKADKLMAINKDLEKTIEVVHKTIESVLDRGTKLESLVKQSEDLGLQSKMFYDNAAAAKSVLRLDVARVCVSARARACVCWRP